MCASQNIKRAKGIYINNSTLKYHVSAKRLDLLLSGQSHDIHSADVYYHQSCYLNFVRITKESKIKDGASDEENVLQDFFTSIQLNIIRDENAYLLTQLLEDWIRLCDERGIETLITRTNQIRRKIVDRFGDEIGFFPTGKFVIVHSALINPCKYSVATIKGNGLRDIDISTGFAAMIRRKLESISSNTFPCSTESLREELYRGPMKDLYNVIY